MNLTIHNRVRHNNAARDSSGLKFDRWFDVIYMELRSALVLSALGCTAGWFALCSPAADWPQWRGPAGDGTTPEPLVNTNWTVAPPTPVWTARVGRGYAGVAICDGRAFTLGNVSNQDIVVCFDAATGARVWEHAYPAPARAPGTFADYPGPRATPTVSAEHVYTLSQDGQLKCLRVRDGQLVWETRILRDPSERLQEWYGFSSSPRLDRGTLHINHGSCGLQVDAATGALRFPSDGKVSGYAAPQLWRTPTNDCLVLFGWNTVRALNLASNALAWSVPWKTRYDVNTADPVVCPEGIFVTSGYEVGCALLDPATGREQWRNKAIRSQCSPVVYRDGYVYGLDGYINAGPGWLVCLQASTGKEAWRQEGLMGNLIVVDRYLMVLTVNGLLTLARAAPDKYVHLGSVRVLDGVCWIPPSYAGGRLYCRNNEGKLVCYRVAPAESP